MRLGTMIDTDRPIDTVIEQLRAAKDAGMDSAWSSQIFGADALTALAVAAREVDGIDVGTAVVPIQPRHPQVLAQQALTVQAVTGGRLTLGIGLSHKVVVDGMWKLSFDKPATYMREYLDALVPMLVGETVNAQGEFVSAVTMGPVGPAVTAPPSLMVAALGPVMLELAGARTDGTLTWMTGTATLRDYVVPTIAAAASRAGRPAPRIGASLPVCVTTEPAEAKERIDKQLAIYPTLPSYKAMLDREGATAPSDVAIIGPKSYVIDALGALVDAGVTEFIAAAIGTPDERDETFDALVAHKG